MQFFIRLAVGVSVLAIASPVCALSISTAKVAGGSVHVKGTKAVPLAVITWEGASVTIASKAGDFGFETAMLPAGCVGNVSDGNETVPAVLQSCGPVGPAGPPGPPGPPGTPAPSSTVINTAIQVGTFGSDNGNATTLATLDGVSVQGSCFPAVAGNPSIPVQGSMSFINAVNGGAILSSIIGTATNLPISSQDDPQPSGFGFNPGTPTNQEVGAHGIVAADGGTGAVRVDLSTYVTFSSLLRTSFCHFFGVLTPTS